MIIITFEYYNNPINILLIFNKQTLINCKKNKKHNFKHLTAVNIQFDEDHS